VQQIGARGWYSGYLMGVEDISMKIHAGYEISYDCPKPKPMNFVLRVHTP
jgi:hypothetical protein